MMPFVYPAERHIRRHGPQGYADYASFRPFLRDEFDYRCVFCLLREQWGRVRGEFHLDHFRASARRPEATLRYENMLYCCVTCNLAKARKTIPDPCKVLLNGQVKVREDGTLQITTPAAERLVEKLGLDRPEACVFRQTWISIIAMAEENDPELYQRLMGEVASAGEPQRTNRNSFRDKR